MNDFIDADEETMSPAAPTVPKRQQLSAERLAAARARGAERGGRNGSKGMDVSEVAGRVPPHSNEAEEYLLSCCFLDGREVVARCLDSKVTEKAFYDYKNRTIYEALVTLYRRGEAIDLAILAEELKTARHLDEVGGYAYLMQVSGRIPTTAQATYFIEKVKDLHTLRELIKVATGAVERCYGYEGDLQELMGVVETTLRGVIDGSRGKEIFEAVGAMSFSYPTTTDPDTLLGHDDWLGRGGGMLFVSHAGAGKSSCIIDACAEWCRGRAFMGIPSNGRHKVLIIQAEDSKRYLGKVMGSYRAANPVTEEESAHIDKHLLFAKIKGLQGDEFLAELENQIRRHAPDIVVINPVYLYIRGSVSDDETASAFLSGLDRINARNGDRVGFILVHHTGKPPRANEEKRDVMDWETAYAGIGTSFWANWPRCSMLLEPRAESGRYYLRLGKAGANAGVVREYQMPSGQTVVEPVTKLAIRHSQQVLDVNGQARRLIYWEPDTEEVGALDENETAKGGKGSAGGRARKEAWTDAEILSYFPAPHEEPKGYKLLAREADEMCGIGEKAFGMRRTDYLARGWLEQIGKGYRRTAIGDDYARLRFQPT